MSDFDVEVALPLLMMGREDISEDALAYIRFFNPMGTERWYICAHDPTRPYHPVIGLQILGDEKRRFGMFLLDELRLYSGVDGIPLKRDFSFKPTQLRNCL